jgi:cytochrome c oxidase cbb3-type subunit 4
MDINEIRGWFTVIMIIMFVLIVAWAWSHKRVKDFKEAANLPLSEPEHPRPVTDKNKGDAQ